jgi:diguanylate cyclase (GGDEF)-like protein/PAS domain S-box-containing protein
VPVTSEKALWQALARSEVAAVHLSDDLTIRDWTEGAARLTGFGLVDVIGRRWTDLGVVGDPVRARQFEALVAGALAGKSWSGERTLRRADGRPVAVRATVQPVLDDVGAVDGVLLLAFDVSEREAYERALLREAMRDPLTGLANRTLLLDRLSHLVGGEEIHTGSMAVVFVDLDGFKAVNDEHGHAVGDAVLREVANRLRAAVRDADMVGRLGGDEFVVLCRLPDGRGLPALRERIVAAIDEPIEVGARQISVRASVGGALVEHGADAGVVLDLADADMYRAKTLSRPGGSAARL